MRYYRDKSKSLTHSEGFPLPIFRCLTLGDNLDQTVLSMPMLCRGIADAAIHVWFYRDTAATYAGRSFLYMRNISTFTLFLGRGFDTGTIRPPKDLVKFVTKYASYPQIVPDNESSIRDTTRFSGVLGLAN